MKKAFVFMFLTWSGFLTLVNSQSKHSVLGSPKGEIKQSLLQSDKIFYSVLFNDIVRIVICTDSYKSVLNTS